MSYNKKYNRHLDKFVEEVLSHSSGASHSPTAVPHKVTDHFHGTHFVDKVDHPHLENIPLTSQATRQKTIWPTHTSSKRKLIMEICSQLKANMGGMVKLRLGSYDIDDDLLKLITDKLTNNTFLQYLILHNNSITDVGVGHIVKALRRHPAVHTLWLGDNKISDEGVRSLCSLLRVNHHIRDLILSNKWPHPRWTDVITSIHPHITQVGADLLADQLKDGCSLTNLNLANQRIRDVGADALFAALPFCKIRTLNLEANELTDACCSGCCKSLAKNPCIEKLILSKNQIGDVGACAISRGLTNNKYLKVLDLSYNIIDCAGMNGLYMGVSMSRTVWSVIVVGNKVVDNRFEALFEERQPKLDFSADLPSNAPYAQTAEEMPWQQTVGPVRLPPVANVGFHGRLPTIVDKLTVENLDAFNKLSARKSRRSKKLSLDDYSIDRLSVGSDISRSSKRSRPGSAKSQKSIQSDADDLSVGSNSTAATRRSGNSQLLKRRNSLDKNTKLEGLDSVPPSRDELRLELKSRAGSTVSFGGNLKIDSLATPGTARSQGLGGKPSSSGSTKSGAGTPKKRLTKEEKEAIQKRDELVSEAAAMFEKQHVSALWQFYKKPKRPQLAVNIGKTVGVPSLGPYGVMPIRTHIKPYSDSLDHSLYLRVVGADDPDGAKPVPILKLIERGEQERERIKATRDERYRQHKRVLLNNKHNRKIRHHQFADVPDSFWKSIKKETVAKYPDGIDHAPGVKHRQIDLGAGVIASMFHNSN